MHKPIPVYYKSSVISGSTTIESPVTEMTAYEGYGYYEEGINPSLSDKDVLLSTNHIYRVDGKLSHIPVKSELGGVAIEVDGSTEFTTTTSGFSRILQHSVTYLRNIK